MEHVLDVYKLSYNEDYPVVCLDESPKQLIEEIASTAMKPGQEARDDYEYLRHRMVNIFMPNEPLKETLFVEVTEFKIKKDWATFVKRISDEMYPQAKKIKLEWTITKHMMLHRLSMKSFCQKKPKDHGIDSSLFLHPSIVVG